MAIDFTLTAEQVALRKTAREFAQDALKPIVGLRNLMSGNSNVALSSIRVVPVDVGLC